MNNMAFTGAKSMKAAIVIFFTSLFLAAGLALVGGLVLDTWYNTMLDMGWFDIPAEWDSSAVLFFLMRLFYLGALLIAIYGIAVLAITIYHKYVLDDDEDDDNDDPASMTYLGGNI